MHARVVALDKEDVELVHPASAPLLHSEISGGDIELDRDAGAATGNLGVDSNFGHIGRAPHGFLETIFKSCGLFRIEVAGTVAEADSAAPVELDGQLVILVVSRAFGGEAELVSSVSVLYDAGEGGGQIAGAANRSAARGG